MKNKFAWYFPPSDKEIIDIWEKGILTVDANVLLDLYRYHESTRNSLINSLKNFNGKLWLSNQAAEEFIRNRTKVIISSEETFEQARVAVDNLSKEFAKSVGLLKNNRIIPAEVADSLLEAVTPEIDKAKDKVITAKSEYPKYLENDPILEDLCKLFGGSIGDGFDANELDAIIKEAEKRKNNQIPPGYLDKEKDGNRPYGDYFIWRQILSHSKAKNIPIIFVTSERKEDWWERISGKTIGPRPELIKEANEICKNRILIYQTERFLEFSNKQSGRDIDNIAVEEIRAFNTLRSDTEHAVELINQIIHKNTEFLHEGILVLNLRRPVQNLTGSGIFKPLMNSTPSLDATLIESPSEMPKFKIRAGAGNNYDFNLHVISSEYGVFLPVGQYKLKYTAFCKGMENQENTFDTETSN